jgi:NhaP-type Na+/H+ or K+/H+ antiporter
MDGFFYIIIMACGIYMIYLSVQMKRDRKIPEQLVGKGFKIERAKDPDGFINHVFPFTLGTGVILFAVGVYLSISNLASVYPLISSLVGVLVLVLIIGYGVILMNAQKKYIVGIDKNGKKLK